MTYEEMMDSKGKEIMTPDGVGVIVGFDIPCPVMTLEGSIRAKVKITHPNNNRIAFADSFEDRTLLGERT